LASNGEFFSILLRDKVELMGVGTRIYLTMRGSSENGPSEGTIEEISPEGFTFAANNKSTQVSYEKIQKLTLKTRKYKTHGVPDPAEVRRVAADLGVGKTARVKLVSDANMAGAIHSLDRDSFVILIKGMETQLNYSQVKEIQKKQMSAGTKAAIAGAAVGGVLLTTYAVLVANDN
jgi:hypothetical protein